MFNHEPRTHLRVVLRTDVNRRILNTNIGSFFRNFVHTSASAYSIYTTTRNISSDKGVITHTKYTFVKNNNMI